MKQERSHPAISALLRARNHLSLRVLAGQVEMSRAGLEKVLNGSRVARKTARLLDRWIVLHAEQWAEPADRRVAALALLLQDLPDGEREAAARCLLALTPAQNDTTAEPANYTVTIPAEWEPTPEAVAALPPPLRKWLRAWSRL